MRISPILFVVIISMVVVFSSCSIEKRIYQPGFHVDWKRKSSSNIGDSASETKENFHSDSEKKQFSVESKIDGTEVNSNPESFSVNYMKNDVSASATDNNSKLHSLTNTNEITKKSIYDGEKNKHDREIRIENNVLSKVSHKIQKANNRAFKLSSGGQGQGSAGLRAIGWVFLILGIVILLFASILIGALLMLLGLAFVIGGAKSSSDSQNAREKTDSNFIDVIYLKNGGIVRGMIIEQMPNVQLKIQTRDGNVFVYKIDEVEKITKEIDSRK
jgi:hypothetical protein